MCSHVTQAPLTQTIMIYTGLMLIAFGSTSAIALNSRPAGAGASASRSSATPFDGYKFRPIEEHVVSREMGRRYNKDVDDYAKCDVVIVGAGSAGLSCAYELSKFPEIKVALIEQSVSPGGGAWLGGQLMSPSEQPCVEPPLPLSGLPDAPSSLSKDAAPLTTPLLCAVVVRKPADEFLDEIGVPYTEALLTVDGTEHGSTHVVVKHAALFTATVLSKVLLADNIKLFNAVSVEDLIVKQDPDGQEGERCVAGVVTNWATVTLFGHDTQSCMDPNTISSKVVVGATGHDGPLGASVVKRLAKLGMLNKDNAPTGMGALDMNTAEDGVVDGTRELASGIILAGMEVAESNGAARMGPTFGAMMISGRKAAYLALNKLDVDWSGASANNLAALEELVATPSP